MTSGIAPWEGPQLVALTPEAKAAAGVAVVRLHRLPFRVGRDRRDSPWQRLLGLSHPERRGAGTRAGNATNELYLNRLVSERTGLARHVGCAHFLLGRLDDSGYYVEDRGSGRGTWVGSSWLCAGSESGAQGQSRTSVLDGNVIVLGTEASPYAFQFFTKRAFDPDAIGLHATEWPDLRLDPIPEPSLQ